MSVSGHTLVAWLVSRLLIGQIAQLCLVLMFFLKTSMYIEMFLGNLAEALLLIMGHYPIFHAFMIKNQLYL